MKEYSFTEARQNFAATLDTAKREGIVCIRKRGGEAFYIRPAAAKASPLDIKGVDLRLGTAAIVDAVRQGREHPTPCPSASPN